MPTTGFSTKRLKMLYRCLNAVQSYIKTIIAVPDTSLHHLAFPSWSSWCYASIIGCRLAFLTEEHEQQTEINETFVEVINIVMNKSLYHEPRHVPMPAEVTLSTWNPVSVAKDGEILSLFNRMYSKMKFCLPQDPDSTPIDHCNTDPLSRIALFQRSLLCIFTNRLQKHINKLDGPADPDRSANSTHAIVLRDHWVAPQTDYPSQRQQRSRIPFMQNMDINSINFDSIAPPDGTFEDWLWGTAMDDFTIPPL